MRPSTSRACLVVAFAVAFGLRAWNASTAVLHTDELHYVADAMWAVATVPPSRPLEFLRAHPKPHPRLDPESGRVDLWSATSGYQQGHPCLWAMGVGTLFALVRPAWPNEAVFVARLVNAAADATTVALLPSLAVALGATRGAGVLAASAYAVFPPAVVYGSIANLDAFLAPLFTLALVLLLAEPGTCRRPGLLGVVTGLAIVQKQTGSLAAVVVPVAGLMLGRVRLRGVVSWTLGVALTVLTITDPIAYADSVLRPAHVMGEVQLHPLTTIAGNLGYLLRPADYYWLSFSWHGQPLAPLVARVHQVLTPFYLTAAGAALVGALVRHLRRELLAIWLPVVLALMLVLPTNGLWRLHLLSPLFCVALACELARIRPWGRRLVLAAGVIAGSIVLLPLRPGPAGQLDLGNLLFMNPAAEQRPGYFDLQTRPLVVTLAPGGELSRLVWLAPGNYATVAEGDGDLTVTVDDVAPAGTPPQVHLVGGLHRLRVTAPAGAQLRRLALVPR